MIVGLGVDVIEVERLKRTLDRYGKQFLDHVFSAEEQADAPIGGGMASYYAGRWAAKEAVAKALGTGIGNRCSWKDIHVLRGDAGRPEVRLCGNGAVLAADQSISRIHISISHERRLACANAVAERNPE